MSKFTYLLVFSFFALFLTACDSYIEGKNEVKAVSDSNFTWVEAPASMKICVEDSDCVMIDNDCNMCCGVEFINNIFAKQFQLEKQLICERVKIGAVCDCEGMFSGASCSDQGVCIGIKKTYN